MQTRATRNATFTRAHPDLPKGAARELATLAFFRDAANVILLDPPGARKTHLAVALIRAIAQGFDVYFVPAHCPLIDQNAPVPARR